MLKLVLPKGSLEKATLELFEAADLKVSRDSAVQYKASIDDPRVAEVRILRPLSQPARWLRWRSLCGGMGRSYGCIRR